MAIDLEVRDPHLNDQGPGSFRRDGYPAGISVACDGFAGYFPFAHLAGGNLEKNDVVSWLAPYMADPSIEKIGAYTIYDLEWLQFLGIRVCGRIHDIQLAESLMDEEREGGYSLESLARSYLGTGKQETLLREAAASFGVHAKKDMWKLHSKFVGPYSIADAVKTMQIHEMQMKKIEEQRLNRVYDMECRIIPLTLAMRTLGVRVNLERAETLSREWQIQEDRLRYRMIQDYQRDVNEWAAQDIARVCDHLKIAYSFTPRGEPSFTKEFLTDSEHPFLQLIKDLRRISKLRRDFIDGLILKHHINGRIHAQFHPYRRDEDGTRSGRFSSSNPNLQQVPARDEELAPIVRSLFIPEEGCRWAKLDYSQQEPRLLVHYANVCRVNGKPLTGATVARDAYRHDPHMDYYKYTGDVAQLKRRTAKDVTLGRFYGLGKKKLAVKIGVSVMEAESILAKYDEHNPYVRELSELCIHHVQRRGYIRTIGGRDCHFDYFVPSDEWDAIPMRGRERAELMWPGRNLVRALVHKSLNRLIQGSAGDMTKLAMLKNYDEGTDVPHMQVHDELNYSADDDTHANRLKAGMENCLQLEVPIVADLFVGDHWR